MIETGNEAKAGGGPQVQFEHRARPVAFFMSEFKAVQIARLACRLTNDMP